MTIQKLPVDEIGGEEQAKVALKYSVEIEALGRRDDEGKSDQSASKSTVSDWS